MARKTKRKSGGELQLMLDDALGEVPRRLAIDLFAGKLKTANVANEQPIATALADHVLTDPDAEFEWLEVWGPPPEGLAEILTIPDEDMAYIDRSYRAFTDDELPVIVSEVSDRSSRSMVSSMKRRWADEYADQEYEMAGFRMRLERRWGKAFASLRMLLTASRELGVEAHKARKRSRSKRNLHRQDVKIRLHARACQVASEVLALMEAGYADGAMARWRTLYEIGVVMTLISEGDDELSRRYLLHDIVESKRSLDTYRDTHIDLGYKPPSKAEADRTESAFAAVVSEFGPSFGSGYGWAVEYLGMKAPSFGDLEKAAGRLKMRSHYKLASQRVHAGVKGITYRLAAMGRNPIILAGPSNAGLVEPGQNSAITLTQITFLLVDVKGIDELVVLKALQRLQEETVRAFVSASRQLSKEEMAKQS